MLTVEDASDELLLTRIEELMMAKNERFTITVESDHATAIWTHHGTKEEEA